MTEKDMNYLGWANGEVARAEKIINADRPDEQRYERAQTHAMMSIAYGIIALVRELQTKGNSND